MRAIRLSVWCLMVLVLGFISVLPATDRDSDTFNTKLFSKTTPEQVRELVGEPDGRYFDGDNEYWLYDVVVWEEDGQKKCPEVLFRKGKFGQINYLTEAIMKKSVAIAKSIADFEPAKEIKTKEFILKDTAVVGKTRAEIAAALGRPDIKKIFQGREVWVYKKVRKAADQEAEISIYIEFDGEKCMASNGA